MSDDDTSPDTRKREFLETNWRCAFCDTPDFRVFGFHKGVKVDVRRVGGEIHLAVLYHGYDLYGPPGNALWNDVTHWRPAT